MAGAAGAKSGSNAVAKFEAASNKPSPMLVLPPGSTASMAAVMVGSDASVTLANASPAGPSDRVCASFRNVTMLSSCTSEVPPAGTREAANTFATAFAMPILSPSMLPLASRTSEVA